MKRMLMAVVALSWLAGGAMSLRAQDQNALPPKVLVIDREMVKVGKGAAHAKNEAAFVRAFMGTKAPDRYLAATAMSGPSEAVFFIGFDSFAAMGEADKYDSQPKVTAAIGPLMEKDADYVSEGRQLVATFNEKWSYRPGMNIAEMRFFELETLRLRAGHDKEWEDLVTLYKTTAAKLNMDENDIFYEVRYGAPDGTVLIFTPRKALSDLDTAIGTGKAFQEALGESGQKKWAQLVEATVQSGATELLEFSPEMSYPPEDWVKSDPSFWKPKPTMAPKGAETKKAPEAPAPKN
jgi:hypothetical protein